MDMRDQILLVKNVISPEDCKRLIDEYESRKEKAEKESCMHANTGVDTVSTYTKVDLKPISYTHNLLFNTTEHMINEWMKHLEKFGAFHMSLLKIYLKCSHRY